MFYTSQEINFLCRLAHFGKMIGYNDFVMLSKAETEKTFKQLEEKNIFSENRLTEYGLALIKLIVLYNKSRRFLKLGSVNFANYQDDEYIMVYQKDNGFFIEPVTQDQITTAIMSKFADEYAFMKEGDIKKRLYSRRKFSKFMTEYADAKAVYCFRFDLDKREEHVSVIFMLEHLLHFYDSTLEEMTIYPKSYVQQGIETIFG